jgi:hypothetical protein
MKALETDMLLTHLLEQVLIQKAINRIVASESLEVLEPYKFLPLSP